MADNENQSSISKTFMKRLQAIEQSRDVKPLCELFTQDAQLENLTRPTSHKPSKNPQPSTNEAASFWRQYLSAFDHVESHFTNVIESENSAVLEWHSQGSLPSGIPIQYSGVSIIEFDGASDAEGSIKKFRTYYDSAALLPHSAKTDKHFSSTVGIPDITNEAGA